MIPASGMMCRYMFGRWTDTRYMEERVLLLCWDSFSV